MKSYECQSDFVAKEICSCCGTFAKENAITVAKALDIFYHSQLYELMSNGVSDMHCMSDEYLVHELINEQKEVNG